MYDSADHQQISSCIFWVPLDAFTILTGGATYAIFEAPSVMTKLFA